MEHDMACVYTIPTYHTRMAATCVWIAFLSERSYFYSNRMANIHMILSSLLQESWLLWLSMCTCILFRELFVSQCHTSSSKSESDTCCLRIADCQFSRFVGQPLSIIYDSKSNDALNMRASRFTTDLSTGSHTKVRVPSNELVLYWKNQIRLLRTTILIYTIYSYRYMAMFC